MLSIFGSVSRLFRIKSISNDNMLFRAHYKLTAGILLVCSLVTTARQFVGHPIECIFGEQQKMWDTYCWVKTTFVLEEWFNGVVGRDVVAPGVGPEQGQGQNQGKRIYQSYYQWVCFVLFFQSVLFYVPRYCWKAWEQHLLEKLATDMNEPIIEDVVKDKRKQEFIDYFLRNFHKQNAYAFRFFFCEALNFSNVILQIYLVDLFLGGEFSQYGIQVIGFIRLDDKYRIDPMATIFPKLTKCQLNTFGHSSTLQIKDGLCLLPINIVNEKIYVFMWFWFIIMAILSAFGLIYRIMVLTSSYFRRILLRRSAKSLDQKKIDWIVSNCLIGDWFLLHQISKNADHFIFAELLKELYEVFEDQQKRRDKLYYDDTRPKSLF